MAVIRSHIPYYKEVFALPGFLQSPALTFGYQDCTSPLYTTKWSVLNSTERMNQVRMLTREYARILLGMQNPNLSIPPHFDEPTLNLILNNYGVETVETLDRFDPRATYQYDMNDPIPASMQDRYNTIIDIGSIEHIFDTRTCLTNLFRMLRVGGHLFIHTPCNGYFKHGYHTLNPDALTQTMELNGFKVVYVNYSTKWGVRVPNPAKGRDVLMWVAARKEQSVNEFVVPQQGKWKSHYDRYYTDK